ncbi:MAG: hypothetical protein VKK05_03090 [Synechococcus sp.]|nr:hypothetical protein [Synechococcus sp.]
MAEIDITNFVFVEPVKVDRLPDAFKDMDKGEYSLIATVLYKILPNAAGDHFIVFEDDVKPLIPSNLIKKRISQTLSVVPSDWDMIHLEYCFEISLLTQSTNTPLLKKAFRPMCTAAIIYNKSSIEKIISCVNKEKQTLDESYVNCIRKSKLTSYISTPPIFAQQANLESDLNFSAQINHKAYWISKFFMMHGNPKTLQRLPSCIDSYETIYYVKWTNVAFFLISICAFIFFIRRMRHH